MEKIVLRGVTISSGLVTILACVCLYFFPEIKVEIPPEPEVSVVPEDKIEVQIQTQPPLDEIVNEEAVADNYMKKLNIQLPEGLHGGQVSIANNYLTQTVTVRFAKGVDNYVEKYRVFGNSDFIASVEYYLDGESGVLEIQLDQVCELSYTYRDGFLCIDFKDPHEIYDKVIVVDAGHGGNDPGALQKKVYEKTINLAILKELKALLDAEGSIKVYYTRTGDTNPTLSQRVGLANKAKADLFISIHNNSTASGKLGPENGTMVLFNEADTSEHSSRRFAELCLREVTALTGSKNKGLIHGNYTYLVRNSEVPVVLMEVGYMTNTKELEKLQTQEYQKLVAQGFYNAVKLAFEEGY